MTYDLELFREEYLKKFGEEKEKDSYEFVLKELIERSKSDNLQELLSSIDKFRSLVFDKIWTKNE